MTDIRRATSILCVDRIEPCLEFWVDRLGFTKIVEVPEGDVLGFVILARGECQVMYQTWDSLKKDLPALTEGPRGPSVLYLDVVGLAELTAKMKDAEIVVPTRTTFYGATELWVREPGGHVIGLSEHPPE